MWYIVGLGNPGKKYENTRHNVGFFVLNLLAKRYKLKFNSNRKGIRRLLGSMKYLSASGYISDEEILLIKPMTYMNRSGRALLKLFKQKTIDTQNLLVIVDDLNLPLGKLRLRPDGGGGGHNGLASIIETLQTKDFPRLRIGIGTPTKAAWEDYVLKPFKKKELEEINIAVQIATEAIEDLMKYDIQTVMNKYN